MSIKQLILGAAIVTCAQPVWAASHSAEPPLNPVEPYIVEKGEESIYPSVAGDFLVFGQRNIGDYRVMRVSKNSPDSSRYVMKSMAPNEDMRFGVAIKNGSVGYVSNRMGPISAWMWQGRGDGQVSIGGMSIYRGTMAPYHLNASSDGKVWCYDSTFQKLRYNQLLDEFARSQHQELAGQQWRTYASTVFQHKSGIYIPTKSGTKNKFDAPVLFIFSRENSQMVMIPNAYDGAISPDGKRVAFVREHDGNYDIWVQDVDGSDLIQVTHSEYGDFEPAWSPDGKQIAFVSNRDYKGEVTQTSIYVVNLDDYQLKRVTNARAAIDGGPAWFDDHSLLFHSNRNPSAPQNDTVGTWNIWKVTLK